MGIFWLFVYLLAYLALASLVFFLLGWWLRGRNTVSKAAYDAKCEKLRSCEKRSESLLSENAAIKRQMERDAGACCSQENTSAEPPVADEKQKTLMRIRERAREINFDRIGVVAEGTPKDDLKRISGIGPFIEEKLNSIGILTFSQISRFTPEDEDKVNDVIEFFPGRIRRDQWVRQAKELLHS